MQKEDKSTVLLLLIGTIIILWLLSIPTIQHLIPDHTQRGTFGDMFGAVNSLFSGLALGGIIYTIFLQKKELALQRQELEETRKELRRSANAQEKSQEAFTKQVEAMELTAHLNGHSTLINYHIEKINFLSMNLAGMGKQEMNKAVMHAEKVEELLSI